MIADLLRHPEVVIERCHDAAAQRQVARSALLTVVVGAALFGVVVGSFRGGTQLAVAGLKLPLATLLALAVCGPGLAAFGVVFDRTWTLREALALLLSAGARSSLVLFALSPVLWLVIDLGGSYHLIRLLAAMSYALAGLSGFAFLLRALGPLPGRAAAALSFACLFLVAFAQSAWLLRPYLGDPSDQHVPLFAQGRREGGLLGVLGRSLEGSPSRGAY
jgi:hypothetical protein